MNEQFFNVSANPHVRDKASTHSIMRDVIIALLPATIFGFWNFGVKAIINTVICILTCVVSEYVWQRFMHKRITISDMSATVTGLLLALNLPPEVPFFIPVIGGVFAIIVVKQIFGGLGQNFMNPALGARCFLLISFAGIMTNFSYNGFGGSRDSSGSAQSRGSGQYHRHVPGYDSGDHRRDFFSAADHRRYLSDRPEGHQLEDPGVLYSNLRYFCPSLWRTWF